MGSSRGLGMQCILASVTVARGRLHIQTAGKTGCQSQKYFLKNIPQNQSSHEQFLDLLCVNISFNYSLDYRRLTYLDSVTHLTYGRLANCRLWFLQL